MIVVRLLGGLGNQMFQYAAGRRAALVRQLPLVLDRSAFQPHSHRAYGLTGLQVEETFATPAQLREIHGPPRGPGRIGHRLRRRFRIGYRWTWIREDRLSPVDHRVLAARAYSYLDGYWQSEKYFAEIAETIRRDFTFRRPLEPPATAIADRIAATEAVSVHVRRGDYVTNPRTNRAHGICSVDYYREAAQRIASRVSHPHFFLFSDDPDWVAANLRLGHPTTLVSHEGADQYQDLELMSRCRHHIIANSSYSWWGAWLNQRPDKMVLAPARWGNDPGWDDRDLLPASWIRI